MATTKPLRGGGYVVECPIEYGGVDKTYRVKIARKDQVLEAKRRIQEMAYEDAQQKEFKG